MEQSEEDREGEKMTTIVLRGKAAVVGTVKGPALVSSQPISFLGMINTETGAFVQKGHDLNGQNISKKILVYPYGKGSSGDSLRIWRCARNNKAPLGIINVIADPIHVQGALLADIPMVYKLDKDPLKVIKSGDTVEIRGNEIRIEPA